MEEIVDDVVDDIDVGLTRQDLVHLGVYDIVANHVLTKNGRSDLRDVVTQLKIPTRDRKCPYKCCDYGAFDRQLNKYVTCPICSTYGGKWSAYTVVWCQASGCDPVIALGLGIPVTSRHWYTH
jgi:hypothetical protein